MTKQWLELKATIKELRDNDGKGTQREVCGFLVRLMNNLEKQIEEPIILDKIRAEIESLNNANPLYWIECDVVTREEVFEIIDKYR